jgi:uncharacterized repeat protein (TIGR03803 family)
MKKAKIVSLLVFALCSCMVAFGQSQYEVFYNFAGSPSDGAAPNAGLVEHNGKLFGTTYAGGSNCSNGGCGTTFVMENFHGRLAEAPIYHFCSTGNAATCPDGAFPGAGLVEDSAGNLYGTTDAGGLPCDNPYSSCGVVFELSASGGTWIETVLHSFNGVDGERPAGQLVFDSAGNLYGTTVYGGAYGAGNVFELSLSGGIWIEKTLHDFNPAIGDGAEPLSGVVLDSTGNLYGTTATGGPVNRACGFDQYYGCGTVLELSPNADGTWAENIIHSFGTNQRFPIATLIFDNAGNLYGTSSGLGLFNGAAFRLSPGANGWHDDAVIFNGSDGASPEASLTIEHGAFYGTTTNGGKSGYGVLFKFQGTSETVIHSFSGSPNDGQAPSSGGALSLFQGSLYGATADGGTFGFGTIFELTP